MNLLEGMETKVESEPVDTDERIMIAWRGFLMVSRQLMQSVAELTDALATAVDVPTPIVEARPDLPGQAILPFPDAKGCAAHPKYRGIRRPRGGCAECQRFYDALRSDDTETDPEIKAAASGAAAFNAGGQATDNQYPLHSMLGQAWDRGWQNEYAKPQTGENVSQQVQSE